jgi:hypothetical protein
MKSNSSTSWSVLTVSCLILVLSINASSQTTEFKSQCKKYVVDCPINISQSSNWMDIVIVQALLKDYLWNQPHANLRDLMKGENRVDWVSFDGDKIYVSVTAYSWPGEDKSKAFEQHSLLLQREYSKQISLLLQDAFTPKKQIVVDVEPLSLSMAIMISSRDLKDKYLRPRYAIGYNAVAIDYSAVRRGIVDAVNQVEGFEINPKTEGTKKSEFSEQEYWSISTHPTVSTEGGFVNKYFLTVEIRPRGENEFWIETLLHLWRRRASSNNWSEIRVGDNISNVRYTRGNNSVPVLNKIAEALRK